MAKKILSFICAIAVILGCISINITPAFADSTRTYELWTQSPNITCGVTNEEVRMYKALNQNECDLYPLSALGNGYYLAICEGKTSDGGYNGKTKTSELYYYVILMTNDSFLIISKGNVNNEYYWDGGQNIANISSLITASYYTSKGYEVPYYIINPSSKYSNSNYTEYDDYLIITKNGNMYAAHEYADYDLAGYPFIKDGVLYRGVERYSSGSRYYYYYLADGSTKAVQYQPYQLSQGVVTYGTAAKVAVTDVTVTNGYSIYKGGFGSNVPAARYFQIPGADNLYITISQPSIYDSAAGRNYYYVQVNIYRNTNGMMSLLNTCTFPTTNTSAYTLPVKSLQGKIDESPYASKGYSPPKLIIGTKYVILKDGSVGEVNMDATTYTSWNLAAYNNKLVIIRNKNGANYIYEKDENNVYSYWQKLNNIYFNTIGAMTMEPDLTLKIVSGGNSGQNGYYSSYSSFTQPNFSEISCVSVQNWFGRTRNNVFPDGRKVNGKWMGMGAGLYELWYEILNPDGSLCSTGPTGYSANFGSVFDTYDLITFAINNSKFIVALDLIQRDWSVEYYRVAVVRESETGEISGSGSIGEKNITPPTDADTEVIQQRVNFADDNLPIGYNIKNNVIDSGKLESGLRQQVNTIRLNDIVILKKSGYISGSQNTGTSLTSYSTYDYGFGSSYIRFYTNGQIFNWYCYYPEQLTAGTYNKTIYVGDKTVYVTIKIVAVPGNNGFVTVVF